MAFVRHSAFILCSFLVLALYTTAQQPTTVYDARWKTVDSLAGKKGLTQSALQEVNRIYVLAKKEKQDAQLLKAILYKAALQASTQENDTSAFIQWQQQTDSASGPVKSIMQSLLADKYLSYFQQHRYQLYSRTATVNFTKTDLTAWGPDDFHKKITALYLASLADEKQLQKIKLEAYDPIIARGNARHLRPTLYDLLVNRALDYFKSDERNVTKAADAFEIADPAFFLPAAAFSKLSIASRDTSSLYQMALYTYQQLLRFHLQDSVPDALLDADISRLVFVQQHAVMENKDSLYENALTHLATQYADRSAAAQAWYLVAQLHAGKAGFYNNAQNDGNATRQKGYIVAAAICRQVLQQPATSEGNTNCYNLLQQIEKKELQLSTEKVNLPQHPFRTLVSYRNCNKLYLRVALLTDELRKQLTNRYGDDYWKQLTALQTLRRWEQVLPVNTDYRPHSTEIKIDALPSGAYILLASANADFLLDKNPLAVQYLYVSGISYISNNDAYFIVDRESGKPLPGAVAQTWWMNYDYTTRVNTKEKGERQTADKNGYLRFTTHRKRQGNFQLEITHDNDRLLMDDVEYVYYRDEDTDTGTATAKQYEQDKSRVFFFTDRSIYRPGQTLYFKGIALTTDFSTRTNKIYSGMQSKIFLRNVDGEDIDSLQLVTNEYGSYTGRFLLPKNMLNGEFSLVDEDIEGSTSFSVEEYKRPAFFVDYEKHKGTYKLNDSITVAGFAKAYAGNNIDGAQVSYRVQRVARFMYPWRYWKWGTPAASNAEISHGMVKTGADGRFSITFRAIPDRSVNKDLEPVFDYRVSVDITDINGETRSGETTIPVGYKALQVKINLPPTMAADSLQRIAVTTQNLNGTFEPALVKLTIAKLQSPTRLINKRYWAQPDQFVMSHEAFVQDFPHDEYSNETDYHSWPVEKVVFTTTDSSRNGVPFAITPSGFAQGWYAIEASSRDKDGDTVKDVQYVQLYDAQSKTIPATAYEWSVQTNEVIEPGERSTITVGSAATDVFLVQEIDKKQNTTPAYNFFTLNGKQSFSFNATEADRGGFIVSHFFVKNNRFYSLVHTISVPWTNKQLQVSYETFRDKTLPGSEEKWKVKVTGYKNERVAAEMLASMYDASLDQFKPHSWRIPDIWPVYTKDGFWQGGHDFSQVASQEKYWNAGYMQVNKKYDALISPWVQRIGESLMGAAHGLSQDASDLNEVVVVGYGKQLKKELLSSNVMLTGKVPGLSIRGNSSLPATNNALIIVDGVPVATTDGIDPADIESTQVLKGAEAIALYGQRAANGVVVITTKSAAAKAVNNVQIRKNFNETAFFFPDLKTDTAGNVSFGFTIPEALTKWTFQSLAHTKALAFGYSTTNVITQKPLMVQPNAPRFLREGDKIELSAKVVNLADSELTGTVELSLFNTATNEPVDGWFVNMYPTQYFTAAAGQSAVVKFSISVPFQYNSAVSYRFVARAGNNTDGEEAALPVLTNRMLVTESMPLPMRGNTAKNFRFEKLLQSENSETLQQYALTAEFTTNPAWYAVQSLPYLMEYPYECAEQTFNRYYANAIAAKVANASPRLQEIFNRWKTTDTAALLSNLQKNPDLTAVLLEETPWVMEAKNETQQKKNIALLFDMVRMGRELTASLEKLKQLQSSNGGFVWFKGGPDNRYITQYILSGIGHLKKLGALSATQQKEWSPVITSAIRYLDASIKEDYDQLVRHTSSLSADHLGYIDIQYLYMRSFFPEYNLPGPSFTAVNYYRKQSQQYWLQQNKYMQGMIALSLFRSGDGRTAGDILQSLKQNAIVNEEMGMYWKDNTAGYYWQQAPVETQALLIEAFAEISKDTKTVNDLKTWLLKQKQTQHWHTTTATADACYALLLQGSDWLNHTPEVDIKLGDKTISSSTGTGSEAGTGYFKQTINGPFVKPAMGDITVKIATVQPPGQLQPAWGAIYWQYFEQLDKITPAATPLQLNKKLFVERNSDNGPVLEPIADNGTLQVGDKIKVRIELRVDRDMEFVHMKDMRASCLEPVNVLSGYKWQGGLGYYESTGDASTNFFFDRLPKGTYVFEYPLFVTHTGNFSNGITSVQCMYAPEFGAHSEGIRINAEEHQ